MSVLVHPMCDSFCPTNCPPLKPRAPADSHSFAYSLTFSPLHQYCPSLISRDSNCCPPSAKPKHPARQSKHSAVESSAGHGNVHLAQAFSSSPHRRSKTFGHRSGHSKTYLIRTAHTAPFTSHLVYRLRLQHSYCSPRATALSRPLHLEF